MVDSSEECDGGSSCTEECLSISFVERYAAALSSVGATLILLLLVAGVLFRRRLIGFLSLSKKGAGAAVSLDDIPLDELEMPWHKWK